jgi:L-malate glycosyltransferase
LVKIVHVDEQLGWRGGERQASWLIQGSAAQGHQVALAGRAKGRFLHDEHGGVEVERIALPLLGEFDLYSAWRLGQWARKAGIDIFHAHTSHAHTMAVLARRFAGRGKVVVHRRVSFPPKTDPVNRWKYHQPDRLVCVSHHVAQVLRDAELPEAKIRVVHSAVDLERVNVEPLPRAELGVAEDALLIVNAGSLVGHKDHANLLNAFMHVRGEFPEAALVIAGEGELRDAIEAQIAEFGLGDAVTLLGHRDDAPRLIRAADLYVSSSWSEGLGTSILEALASKTPVVATRAGGADEMVLPKETGHLVASRNSTMLAVAMARSLKNRDDARRMAEAGLKLIHREFTAERMVEGNLRVYEELLKDE